MKIFFIHIFLLCFTSLIAQNIKVSIANKGALIKDNVEIFTPFILLDKEKDKGKYIIAIKRDHMPQAVAVDELFTRNISEFTFTLNPVTKPILNKSLKKIHFSQFVDPNYHTGRKALLADDIRNKDPKFSVAMDSFLGEMGFNAPQANAVFTENPASSDLLLGAEIVSYKASKHDTPGFRCSAVFKWSVYDVLQQKIIYSYLTGGYSNEESKMNESEAFIIAAKDAMQELLNNKDFIHLVNKEDE